MNKAKEILAKHTKGNGCRISLQENPFLEQAILNAINEAINYSQCCTEFKCGQERVYGEEKCLEQCGDCKLEYSNDI
jgi:hypothetical protein